MIRRVVLVLSLPSALACSRPPEPTPVPTPDLERSLEPVEPGTLTFLELSSDGTDTTLRRVTFDADHPAGREQMSLHIPQETGGSWTFEVDGATAYLTIGEARGYRVDMSTWTVTARFAPLPAHGRLFTCPAGTCALWTVPSEEDRDVTPNGVRAEGRFWPVEGEWHDDGLGLFRVGHWDEGTSAWVEDDARALPFPPEDELRPFNFPSTWPVPRTAPLGSRHDWGPPDVPAPPGAPRKVHCANITGDPRVPGGELPSAEQDTGWFLCEGVRPWAHARAWAEGTVDVGPLLVKTDSGWTDLGLGTGLMAIVGSGRWLLVRTDGEASLVDLEQARVLRQHLQVEPWEIPGPAPSSPAQTSTSASPG